MNKLIRITTAPISLDKLIEGQLAFMKRNYEVIGISAGGGLLASVGKREGIRVIPIEMTRKITPLKDVKAVWELYKLFKKENPYIVHTHTPKAGIVGMLASYLAGVPIRLHTVAGMPLMEAKGVQRKILNAVERLTYACATKVYPNSFGLKEIILANKFTKVSKLKVIANGSSNGIDTSHFNPEVYSASENQSLKEKIGIQPNDFVFAFVGRLVGDKGINELVGAFGTLSEQNKAVKLLLVGPYEAELDPLKADTLRAITNNKQIISVGYQQDVRPYFTISDVFVFPSYREGFPNVVMQAGAMGLPSIVSDINGCNEIIEHKKNGLIISVKDTDELFDAMSLLLINTDLMSDLKKNAIKMISSRYEQKIVWDALLIEYRKKISHVQ
jgi:glycosyltransferase involved in cell wall biosynthesis